MLDTLGSFLLGFHFIWLLWSRHYGTRVAAGSRLENLAQFVCFAAMAIIGAAVWISQQAQAGSWGLSAGTLMAMVLTAVVDFRKLHDRIIPRAPRLYPESANQSPSNGTWWGLWRGARSPRFPWHGRIFRAKCPQSLPRPCGAAGPPAKSEKNSLSARPAAETTNRAISLGAWSKVSPRCLVSALSLLAPPAARVKFLS